VSSDVVLAPRHETLSPAPQLRISQKTLGTFPEDGNVIPKHVGTTIHNLLTECIIVAYINEMHGSRSKIPSKNLARQR
jgi:hypothetical protein